MSSDSLLKCCIQNCKNIVSIPIPDNSTILEKLCEELKLLDILDSGFICSEHYEKLSPETQEEIEEAVGKNIYEDEFAVIESTVSATYNSEDKCEVDAYQNEDESTVEEENIAIIVYADEDDTNTCRLCMNKETEVKHLFDDVIENNLPIFVAIVACLYPIEISKEDSLPKVVCLKCLSTVSSFFKFRSLCLQNDKILKKIYNPNNLPSQNSKRKSMPMFTIRDTKRKKHDHEAKFRNRLLSSSSTEEDSPHVSDISVKAQEELRTVLENTLTAEQAQAENIIIQVENDNGNSDSLAKASELNLPLVIKCVSPKEKRIAKESKVTNRQDDFEDNFLSRAGVFEGVPVQSFFDTEFCSVDEYLFVYRLCKGNYRFLRCIVSSCHAEGHQEKIGDGFYSNLIKVTKRHNHRSPSEYEKKKLILFYVMEMKIKSDKTSNFKSVYEEVCTQDPLIRQLIPFRTVVNEICRQQNSFKTSSVNSFEHFYHLIERDTLAKLQFTHNGKQFYQNRFSSKDGKAVVFANSDIVNQVLDSRLMYVDTSFKIDTNESFIYHLVTVLVWVEDSYYPILFALVDQKTKDIYKEIFNFLHDTLAPKLQPDEIVTDYEANIFYALAETYTDSSIGGSVFYYTQNLYKKICMLNLTRDLETNTYFRNIYHMLLMLPLLPVNTIIDGLINIENQAKDLRLRDLVQPMLDHVRTEWINKVTPDFFCVHRLENRINENVIAPFKKLRDLMMFNKGKGHDLTILTVVNKLIELEYFLQNTYSAPTKRSFARDLSSSQKKNVLRAWQHIENHPKINIVNFFSRVLGYIKCMENQLWIWGFYKYVDSFEDELINASHFSVVAKDDEREYFNEHEGSQEHEGTQEQEGIQELEHSHESEGTQESEHRYEPDSIQEPEDSREEVEIYSQDNNAGGKTVEGQIVMEAVIDEHGRFVLQS